tara:strand:- start:18 stop:329 length:312 start_codon:yes stop_codon:yes gene_type:complete
MINFIKIVLIFPLLILFSCGEMNESFEPEPPTKSLTKDKESVWICHHPNTEFHDKECVENIYPNGCYSKNGSKSYCWLLSRGHCEIFTRQLEWQKKYCPLLNE